MSLDGFSMHRLTRELDRELSGGRVDKITQPNRTTIQISIRQPGKNPHVPELCPYEAEGCEGHTADT